MPPARKATSSRPPACPRHWRPEVDRLVRLFDRVTSTAEGPLQGMVLEEPPGYGAVRLLEFMGNTLSVRLGTHLARLPPWVDAVHDWPSLALEILAQAHEAGAPHGDPRKTLLELRADYGEAAIRTTLDERLVSNLKRHGQLVVLIPGLDRLLALMTETDHWSFRHVLQTQLISVIATVNAGWKPESDQAFLDFFRRTRLQPLASAGVDDLAALFHLSKANGKKLAGLAEDLDGRPALIEAAAAVLTQQPGASHHETLQEVALNHAPFLHEQNRNLAPGARRVLAGTAYLSPPFTTSALAAVADLPTNVVATQAGRLIKAGIFRVGNPEEGPRWVDFADPVVGKLYRALSRRGPAPAPPSSPSVPRDGGGPSG